MTSHNMPISSAEIAQRISTCVTIGDVRLLLDTIPPENYEIWITVGKALQALTGGSKYGYMLWSEWSATSREFNFKSANMRWELF